MKIMAELKQKHGFTLVELIVVLVIIAILAAILVPSMVGWIDRANEKVCDITRYDMHRYALAQSAFDGGKYTANGFTQAMKASYGDSADVSTTGALVRVKGLCQSGGEYSVSFDEIGPHISCSLHGTDEAYLFQSITSADKTIRDYLEKIPNLNAMSGEKLIRDMYKANGDTLLQVEQEYIDKAFAGKELNGIAKDEKLYWRPSLIKVGGNEYANVMFASKGNNDGHAAWAGYLVYYDGKLYKSTKDFLNKVNTVTVTSTKENSASKQAVKDWLENNKSLTEVILK